MGRFATGSTPDEPNVVRLDDYALGVCLACSRPIRFADNFVRLRGRPIHLSCALVAARTIRGEPDGTAACEGAIPRPDAAS
jgi:hypothetical protein